MCDVGMVSRILLAICSFSIFGFLKSASGASSLHFFHCVK